MRRSGETGGGGGDGGDERRETEFLGFSIETRLGDYQTSSWCSDFITTCSKKLDLKFN